VADITNFSDVYLGPAATDPATRNDSSALQAGDLYFNTVDDAMKVYDGAAWVTAYITAAGFVTVADAQTITGVKTFDNGLATDTISEETAAAGVTVDGVLLKDSQVTTDQINEKTSAAGVTIDGVLLKDSEVTTDVIKEKTSAAGVTIDSVLLKDNKVTANELTINSNNISADNSLGFRNRIINGDMRIDQRNAGAVVTAGSGGAFPVDRWFAVEDTDGVMTAEQVEDAPTGFINSVKLITTTADTNLTTTQSAQFMQNIEGLNVYDLGFGSASAKTVTLSFWVKSSLTGLMGGSLRNDAANRSYPFSYTISVADTWEYKSVTIPGDTTGTWLTNNSIGIRLVFGLGSGPSRLGTAGAWNANNNVGPTGEVPVIGTLNATWYVTGVQLEVGSVATPFERRPFGTELALCKRYYDKTFAINTAPAQNAGRSGALETVATRAAGATGISSYFRFSVPMRATPSTVTFYNPSAANGQARNLDLSSDCTSTSVDNINEIGGKVIYILPASTVATNLISVHWFADAEL